MKTNFFIVFLAVFSFSKAIAQSFELGKVSKEELEEKFHPIDSGAAAAILYKKTKIYFEYKSGRGYIVNTKNEIRIKIYKTDGFSWADFKTQYYFEDEDSEKENLIFSNCVTYNLENGVIIATGLNIKDVVSDKINKFQKMVAISMPNVKVGSVIEIKYSSKSFYKWSLLDFILQYNIPINYAEFATEIPEVFFYKTILSGFYKINSECKLVEGKEAYAYKYGINESFPFKYLQCNYIAENIPALKEEMYVDNIKNYSFYLQNELEATRFPGDSSNVYSKTWEDVAKSIYKFDNFGKELKKEKYFEDDLKLCLDNSDKVNSIFNFVQNKMNWNAQEDFTTDKGVKKAYFDETGNTAEINFILIAMLKKAGINSNPVVLSTVEHGILSYPSIAVFNAVIAAVEIDGKQILLDATSKYASPNILPLKDLNGKGRLIKEDGTSQEVNLVPKTLTTENTNLMVVIDNMGKISGQVRNLKTDYDALTFREKNEGFNKDIYLEKLESDLNGIQISDYSVDNMKDLSKPIVENFTFTSDSQCDIIEGKIYLTPLLFLTQKNNPFVQEKREMPIYFGYPKQSKFNVNIEIPKGYSIESMPKPIKISTGENVGLFMFNINSNSNKIQVQITREINTALVSPDYYDVLKAFHQKMIDKLNEKIVLKKI